MITPEMRAMADACAAVDTARAKHLAAQVAFREAQRELDAAMSRKTIALDALERSCRASLPTLPEDAETTGGGHLKELEGAELAKKIREAIAATIATAVLRGTITDPAEAAGFALGAAANFSAALVGQKNTVANLAICLLIRVEGSSLEAHRAVGAAFETMNRVERREEEAGAELLAARQRQ